ncbi:hypothetical protein WISP_134046 [Willisornis vidua]|uniref:Uncharacterized protein n=1 Tax=Willisornis vidua TaxID=1566151 RepID=A0ABQ9CNT3_9PASS|nr:hypothetical protein WISP_134046 [Willisornis vidua]
MDGPVVLQEEEHHLCDVGEFLCHDRVTCVSQHWLCDGEPDCPDDSDESLDTWGIVSCTGNTAHPSEELNSSLVDERKYTTSQKWYVLGGTLKIMLFRHLPLDQVAPSLVQPGLEHQQIWTPYMYDPHGKGLVTYLKTPSARKINVNSYSKQKEVLDLRWI